MRTARQLSEIARKLDKIEVALIVRDPGTSLSADAYDGLRRQIIASVQERTAHLVQLALMDEALREARDIESFKALVDEWMSQAGLARVEDPHQEPLFEVVSGKGAERELVAPAYVDVGSNRLIKQGRVRAFEGGSSSKSTSDEVEAEPKAGGGE